MEINILDENQTLRRKFDSSKDRISTDKEMISWCPHKEWYSDTPCRDLYTAPRLPPPWEKGLNISSLLRQVGVAEIQYKPELMGDEKNSRGIGLESGFLSKFA